MEIPAIMISFNSILGIRYYVLAISTYDTRPQNNNIGSVKFIVFKPLYRIQDKVVYRCSLLSVEITIREGILYYLYYIYQLIALFIHLFGLSHSFQRLKIIRQTTLESLAKQYEKRKK